MTTLEFLAGLQSRDIRIWAEGDQLAFRAPEGALTPALRAELTTRKPELLALLRDTSSDQAPLLPGSRGGDIPLSFGQESLWFMAQLEPDSPVYNVSEAFRLLGRLDQVALEQSLNEVVRRHEVLRTSFPAIDGRPTQLIHTSLELRLRVRDLQELPRSQRDVAARQLVVDDAGQPFDLARGPLLRFLLLRLDAEEHIFVLSMHHIISDGWSSDSVMFPEISALYRAFVSGVASPLPEPEVQYADYAHWQRGFMQGQVLEAHLQYWRRQLGGASGDLALPADYPLPPERTNRGAEQSCVLPDDLAAFVESISHQAGVTPFMTLLAAFKVLLWRYCGQDDIVVATPVAGRTRPETEAMAGFFVNTLVLRTDLSGDPSFWQLLEQVQRVCLDGFDHQDLPFEKLVEDLRPDRALGRNPLFRVMFQLLAHEPGVLALDGLEVSRLSLGSEYAMFDLSLDILQEAGKLRCVFNYSLDLFEHATIERMLGHFLTLLACIAADPKQPLSRMSLLTEAERRQMLVEWNQTEADHAQGMCAHQLFEAQVERNPDAVAVAFGDQELTYRQLDLRANQLARYLQGRGVGPEVFVGLCMQRSVDMVVAILGILKAGGAYVPLDPAYPPERLSLIIKDAQIRLLLTTERLAPVLPVHDAELICLDVQWQSIAPDAGQRTAVSVSPQSVIYVIYTSGSMGRPKGVLITHGALVNYALAVCRELGREPGERLLQVASTSFDSSADEIFTCLLSGATLVLPSDEIVASAPTILQRCRDWQITALDPPTVVWHALVAVLDEEDLDFPETVRLVYFGGERALPQRLAAWRARVGDRVRLLNGYGPTELTIGSTIYPLDNMAELVASSREVPIGYPMSNTQAYVLDRNLNPVPIGVPGELCVSGAGVARGYFSRPGLTADVFVPCPFGPEPGARMYKTGDLVRYLPDGCIEFLGRLDNQVKIRGFRIELGEIETVLAQHPDVRDVVVGIKETASGDERLVAYVVPARGATPVPSELRRYLQDRLPDYMTPATFVAIDALPLMPTGKVDRNLLPEPEWSSRELEQAYVAPRTPTETTLAGIWAQVLGLDQVGIHDSFFDLGGHSLLATQVISRMANAFHVKLPLHTLFRTPTIAGLANTIEMAQWATQDPSQRPAGAQAPREEFEL